MNDHARSIAAFVVLTMATMTWARPAHAESVDFLRDVRPVLARHCFKCHGPDDQARKAKLRLDVREAAVGKARSGLRPNDVSLQVNRAPVSNATEAGQALRAVAAGRTVGMLILRNGEEQFVTIRKQ